ncbi:kelch protein [Anaeramoeba flamelloides]|uniref:Kelch protein n=1 Tax=Anaeramoeba flamelloides TaxID=1746091 RepID=A0ABQ8YP32_9EUKA|nr:kelch protein [Anaeramoeba flamelloides]
MDSSVITDYLNNNYQKCPNCNKLIYIETVGCGFYECECQAIFCCYCAKKQKSKFQAFSHYLLDHSSDHKNEEQTFETKNGKEISKDIKVIKIKVRSQIILMQKEEKVDVLVQKYCKLKQNNLYVRCFCYENNYFEKGKTIEHYQIANNAQVKINLMKLNGKFLPLVYLKYLDFMVHNDQNDQNKIIEQRKELEEKEIQKKKEQMKSLNINGINLKTGLHNLIANHFQDQPNKIRLIYNGKKIDKSLENYRHLQNHYSKNPVWVILSDEYKLCYEHIQFCAPFYNLLRYGENTDLEICGFQVHSQMLKFRLNVEPMFIKNTLENSQINKSNIKQFLDWVYLKGFEKLNQNNNESLLQCFKLLNVDPNQMAIPFSKQLNTKWKDNEDKDFIILVKDQDDEDQNDGTVIEIPVHRIILQARSNLFREMFNTINVSSNQVTDYSGKSVDTIEILIGYFYTNSLKITADMDIDMVLDELNDAAEYYQIIPNFAFLKELKKLKRQYNKD